MTIEDKVKDEEILYRSVAKECFTLVDGNLKLTSTAFNDPAQNPSVDRAKLCGFNPAHAKKKPAHGVVSLTALSVRQIADVIQNDEHGQPESAHEIDVMSDPIKNHLTLPDNPAHALIIAHPDFANDKVFKKLKKSLARIASQGGWLIEPT
ncbi:MAG: hypothetical protein EPO47_05925 [Rugosibacter sp.]|nr:MAG: hypothetical protein EPO60_07185 [Rugosibacter sp.]TBR09469.1 MAG: hypothetical protein EPO47_05925 [Rugosibacter sp.]